VLGGVDVGDRAQVEAAVARFAERGRRHRPARRQRGLTHYERVAEQSSSTSRR
jgi:hypothetical protein